MIGYNDLTWNLWSPFRTYLVFFSTTLPKELGWGWVGVVLFVFSWSFQLLGWWLGPNIPTFYNARDDCGRKSGVLEQIW